MNILEPAMPNKRDVPMHHAGSVSGVREEASDKPEPKATPTFTPDYDKEQGSRQSQNVSGQFAASEQVMFFQELGVPQEELLNSNLWERWIDGYWKYRTTLTRRAQGYLHWRINRFYFMVIEMRLISLIEALTQKREFREKYRIPPKEAQGTEAYMWLVLAGAYVEGLRARKVADELEEKIERFYSKMPPEWLDVTSGRPHQLTPYEKFIQALDANWNRFIRSYETDAHVVVINHFPMVASLNSFLEHKMPDGTPLRMTDPRQYWPKPLAWYALSPDGARLLYEATLIEFKEYLLPGAASAYSLQETRKAIPYWMKLGMD
ncbi:MAG: hypothetical protein AB1898_30530 [Acidobacteriota bacterium]